MIVGTGIDMVEIERIAEKIGRGNGFREKVFSAGEIDYCEQGKVRAEHYAARFAAKEAFLKATGLGLQAGHDLFQIEVVVDPLGKPSIVLHGDFKKIAEQYQWNTIHLSLSHVRDLACAFVILEK
jgi:holo-[acyl-carrier protein] synthase